MIRRVAVCVAFLMSVLASTLSHAATSTFAIFPDRVFSNGAVVNAGNLFGNNTATEATFNPGGIALFDFGQDRSNYNFTIEVTGIVSTPTTISVRFVNVSGFTVTDTAPGFFPFDSPIDTVLNIAGPGAFTVTSGTFAGACAGIGGCNSVLLNVTGASSFTAAVVSSAPEPSAWALMLLGFGGLAWRMKALRRQGATAFAAQPA